MADFIYQEPYPIEKDTTEYELLTTDYVKVVECDGRKILKVDPKGIELLAKEAYNDVSFYLRSAHLQKLNNILNDPEATDNDKFVAYTMLMNSCVAAEGELPTCQDTGTAICVAHKGEDVYTGVEDAEYISRGAYQTYAERNLRYSQVVPITMTDEHNSGTNLPAQIDIYGGHPGMEYEFLFITKGGGSANKTFLYQQTKALLNEESLTKFIKEKHGRFAEKRRIFFKEYLSDIFLKSFSAVNKFKIFRNAAKAAIISHLIFRGNFFRQNFCGIKIIKFLKFINYRAAH